MCFIIILIKLAVLITVDTLNKYLIPTLLCFFISTKEISECHVCWF